MIEPSFQIFSPLATRSSDADRLFWALLRSAKNLKKIEKIDFFKMNQLLTPTMIIENTQLGKVVSLLKGLEHHFYVDDEKSIFDPQSWTSSPFLV